MPGSRLDYQGSLKDSIHDEGKTSGLNDERERLASRRKGHSLQNWGNPSGAISKVDGRLGSGILNERVFEHLSSNHWPPSTAMGLLNYWPKYVKVMDAIFDLRDTDIDQWE